MIQTGFEKRVQVQQILANQLPDFIRAESPKTLDFLKQYYISQEHQSGATDLADNDVIEIQAFPDSNDNIGLKDLYLSFSVSDSTINMVNDTISSGEQISGVGYKTTSSYLNGSLKRGDTSTSVASVSTTTTTSSTTTTTSSGTSSSGGGY